VGASASGSGPLIRAAGTVELFLALDQPDVIAGGGRARFCQRRAYRRTSAGEKDALELPCRLRLSHFQKAEMRLRPSSVAGW